jgi:hypothetical protein
MRNDRSSALRRVIVSSREDRLARRRDDRAWQAFLEEHHTDKGRTLRILGWTVIVIVSSLFAFSASSLPH